MEEKLFLILMNISIFILVLLLQILLPLYTRKDILLGVKVPEDKLRSHHAKTLVKKFQIESLLVGISSGLIISGLTYYFTSMVFIIGVEFIYIFILFMVYLKYNKKAKKLKKDMGWDKLKRNMLIVDTRFSQDKEKISGISNFLYLIPLAIILFNVIFILVKFDSFPDTLPSHWNFQGQVDGYMNKSIFSLMLMPITMVIMLITIYLSNYGIIKSKQEIRSSNPELSLRKNIIFRKAWSGYFLGTIILIELMFTYMNLMILGIFTSVKVMNYVIYGTTGVIVLGSIVLSLGLGQGGDKIKLKEDNILADKIDMDDDKFWLLGNSLYYNPDDPSLFLEKRIGVGFTVNVGRPLGLFIALFPLILTIVSLILIKK